MYARKIHQYFIREEEISKYEYARYDLVKSLAKSGYITAHKGGYIVLLDNEIVEKFHLEVNEFRRRQLLNVFNSSYRNEKILNTLELYNNHVFFDEDIENLHIPELNDFIDKSIYKTYLFTLDHIPHYY